MPIYEYACTACGRSIDVIHGIYGEGPKVCQFCGGAMKKQLTAPAIHFKGSGWAKKDARSATASAASTTDKKVDDAPASGGATPSSETTTATPEPAPAATPAASTPSTPSTPSTSSTSSSGS